MKTLFIAFFAVLVLLFGAFPSTVVANDDLDPCAAQGEGGAEVEGLLSVGCSDTSFGFILGQLINFIFVIAVVLALGFLVYGGVRWITSGGDKTGVEHARNMIIASLVGLLVIVLAYFILNNLVLPFLGMREGFRDLEVSSIRGGPAEPGTVDCSQYEDTNCPVQACRVVGFSCVDAS